MEPSEPAAQQYAAQGGTPTQQHGSTAQQYAAQGEPTAQQYAAQGSLKMRSFLKVNTSFTQKMFLFTVIVAGVFAYTFFLNWFYGFLLSGFSGGIFRTLEAAYYVKPLTLGSLLLVFLFIWLFGVVILVWRNWSSKKKGALNAREYSREELRQAIQSQYQRRFWVSFAVYSAVIVLLIFVFFLVKDSTIWYANDPWFYTLALMRDLFPLAIIVLWLTGVVILLFNQWRQSSSDIVGLVDSIEHMQEGEKGEQIGVPHNLEVMRPVLQNMFDSACENQEAAAEAETRKRDLILYLAHDLKTPLTSVIGYLSLLTESNNLTKVQEKEYARIAQEKALRLETLIEQFFEISRFSLHDVNLSKESFSLNFMLQQLSEEFFPVAENAGKQLEIVAEEDLEIHADAGQLARVFDNILRNAIAYSKPQSTIRLHACYTSGAEEARFAHSNDKLVRISISNEGDTIPQEQLNSIFNKFFRLDESRTSESGGAGLGLAIAKEIVNRHKGTLEATSEEGITMFTLVLPK